MHSYRFRLLYEEQEEFLRDFDVLASQTFLDFHNLIVQSVELKGDELASFFICDKNWRKKKEITLIDMKQSNEDSIPYEDDDEDNKSGRVNRIPIYEMANVKIRDLIDDPHQRLLYEYDFLNPKSFFIELMKINNADPKEQYPICVKSVGKLTPVASIYVPFIAEDADEITLPGEFDEITQEDTDDNSPDISSEFEKEW